MRASLDCIFCMLEKANKMYAKYETNKNKRLRFIKTVMKVISEASEDESAPTTTAKIQRELSRHAGISDHFRTEKEISNHLALQLEDEIWANIRYDKAPLKRAIKYALAGNFIDLGVYDAIEEQEILKMVENAARWEIDQTTYSRFERDLDRSTYLVYLTDNAGEIVFDKLLIQLIGSEYKHLKIDIIVRGRPILNDATMKDAEDIGITEIASVTENGSDIPGTDLHLINNEAKALIERADMIISKGMGNFESLYGSEYNIYFAFLCKCKYFSERFNVGINDSIFLHNDAVHQIDIYDKC